MKIDWKRKLSSRKLWAAAAGIVTGLAMVFGLDQNTISTVAGAVVSAASVVAYVMAEGKVDAEGVQLGVPAGAQRSGSGGERRKERSRAELSPQGGSGAGGVSSDEEANDV